MHFEAHRVDVSWRTLTTALGGNLLFRKWWQDVGRTWSGLLLYAFVPSSSPAGSRSGSAARRPRLGNANVLSVYEAYREHIPLLLDVIEHQATAPDEYYQNGDKYGTPALVRPNTSCGLLSSLPFYVLDYQRTRSFLYPLCVCLHFSAATVTRG